MKQNYFKNLLIFFAFLWSIVGFAQPILKVTYGSSPTIVLNNTNPISTVNFGLSGEITFSVKNAQTHGASSVVVQSITSSTSAFIVSSQISDNNIKNGETGYFKIKKNSITCGVGASVITIYANAGTLVFNVNFDNTPSISVLGGSPTQLIPNGQTTPTSATGTLFGTIDVLAFTNRTFYIANTGTCPLAIGTITSLIYDPISGITSASASSDFFIVVQAVTNPLSAGGSTGFVIRFRPESAGTKWARITIPSDDPLKPSYTFLVKGEGYNPNLTGPGGGNSDFRLWLKSTRGINVANDAKVPLWKDLGSTGKNAAQTTVLNQPTFKDAASDNINFNPVVKFNNIGTNNQFLYSIDDDGYYTQETFIVMEPDVTIDGSTPAMTIISGTSPTPGAAEHSGIGFGNFSDRLTNERLWFNQWQTTATTPYFSVGDVTGNYSVAGIINTRNKTAVASDGMDLAFNSNEFLTPLTSSSRTYDNLGGDVAGFYKGTPYNIGKNINSGTANGNLNGRVAEILSYASRLEDNFRVKIETYLAIKYGITLGLNGTSKNYVNSAGAVIWDITNIPDFNFNYNIAGIGRDVASDLYQKQSKSSNASNEVTIGLGEIAVTNSANINQFTEDRNFLVWGSNDGNYLTGGGSNTATLSADLTTTVTTKINKKWKIVETGGDVGNVFVSIPAKAFEAFGEFPRLANEEYALIVSDNPLFRDEDIIDVIPLKRNMTAATVTHPDPVPILNKEGSETYQTWYDFDGIKYFTFGKVPKVESKGLINVGNGDYLVGEYALNLNSGSFTIGCWLRNDGAPVVGVNKTIMAKGINLELRLNANNKIEALWDGVLEIVSNTAIGDNKWHNVVAVYYLGSADLYIDGVLDSSTFDLQNPSPNFSRYSVGALYANKGDIRTPFYGEIDEINIWNMALTSNQINYLMNQEIEKHSDGTTRGKVLPQNSPSNAFKTILWTQLVAYYDFNIFYGTTVEGLTGDRNFLRIKYLDKDKNNAGIQTAPLPYETIADGEWNSLNSAMWKNGAIQTIPNDVSIVNAELSVNGNIVKIKNDVTSIGNKTVLGLFVEGTDATTYKTLSAINNTKVQISHYLKLDGLIDLKGRSQLVQTLNSDLDPLSIGFIKRDQQGTVNKYNYNYWTSPVGPINGTVINNDYTVEGVLKDGTTTGVPKDINWISGLDGNQSSPLSLARYWLYKFQNGTEYADWIHFAETDVIKPSQGFIFKGAGAVDTSNLITQNYTFKGKPYNGLINGNSVLTDNLFLVGNPYPSALDAFEFIRDNISVAAGGNNTENIIDGTLYFWQHSPTNNTHYLAGYTGGYATITLTGGVFASEAPLDYPLEIGGRGSSTKIPYQYIPVGQGFFVNGYDVGASLKPIVFNNNQRAFIKEDAQNVDTTPVDISNTLFKSSGSSGKAKIVDHFNDNSNDVVYRDYNTKIRLGSNTVNNFHRQLLLGFMNDDATDGFDIGYDGYQIDTQDNDVYFLIDDWEYTVQGVGYFDVNKTYPLGVKTDTIGNVQFMVDSKEFLAENQKIYIHDKETSIYYDITEKAVDVKLPAGTYNTRFELTFRTDKTLTIGENEVTESLVIVYSDEKKKKLVISKNKSVEIKEISIYNMIGQQLSVLKKVTNGSTVEMPFNVERGVYLIKIITNEGVVSKKVLKQ